MTKRRGGLSNSGIGLPDIGLVGGVVGVNHCSTEDDSWYCNLSRVYSAITMIIGILIIISLIYYFAKLFLFNNNKSYIPKIRKK